MLKPISRSLRAIKALDPATVWDTITHQVRQRLYQARLARNTSPNPSTTPDYLRPGPVTGHARQGQTVTVACANGSYTFTVLAPDLVRVHLHPATGTQYPISTTRSPVSNTQPLASTSYAIAKPDGDWPSCDFHADEAEAAVEIRTSRLVCQVAKASGRLAFLDLDGNVINEDDGESLAYRQGEYRLTRFTLAASAGRLDLTREVESPFDPGYARFQMIVHSVEGPPEAVEGLPGAEVACDPQGRTWQVSGELFDEMRVRW